MADVPNLRPTPVRLRETLFNWLAPSLAGARCLDLFAGTGALGLEALSRGAARVVFVESSVAAERALRGSLERLGADRFSLVRADVRRYLQGVPEPFDFVFLDPPFGRRWHTDLCTLLHDNGWLAPGARVSVECPRSSDVGLLPADWLCEKNVVAGQVRLMLATPGAPP